MTPTETRVEETSANPTDRMDTADAAAHGISIRPR